MDTVNTLKVKLAMEKLNRAQAVMSYAPITTDDDPRIQLSDAYNRMLAELTPDERDALLDELGY